jgi:hypothetical protein
MPRLSLGLGVQAVSKVKSGGAAPSGIPVSTINLIIIQDGVTSGPYTKISSLLWSFTPNFGSDPYLQYNGLAFPNGWSLYASDGEGGYNLYNVNRAGSSTIPTSGWDSSITITAA